MQIAKASSTVFTPLPDGTGVLLNVDTLLYYSLNRTGAVIWQQIEQGTGTDVANLAERICELFDVEEAEAMTTLRSFVDNLVNMKLVSLS